MKVSFHTKGGFDNVLKWFDKASNIKPSMVGNIASQGVARLSSNTPKDTGETALSWVYDVTANKNTLEIAWKNIAHPESQANVATLIELGHGTRNGGYVQPRPYIKQSMEPVWRKLDNDVKGLMK